ncbi:MAG TPA: hypothetical protein VHY79_02075 [Rhizomicrobium sp.]|nr:hypothetical protein [Rhizomicrobium sp.]
MKPIHIGAALRSSTLALSLAAGGMAPALAAQLRDAAAFPHRAFVKPSSAEIRNALQHAGHRAKRDDAQYTIIDDPGEGYALGQGTFGLGLNSSGVVVGYYDDGNTHGFERTPDGSYRTIDVGRTGTAAGDINDHGAIAGGAGFYTDMRQTKCPGFLRTPKGRLKKFEPPNGAAGCYQDVFAINNSSSIIGDYKATDGLWHGYLRTKDGTIGVFDVAGAADTYATDINDNGAAAGVYIDSNGYHGYIRMADGSFTTFDAPGGPGCCNIAARINKLGEVQGDYLDDNGVSHALIRAPDASIVVYDAPDAGQTTGQGTAGYGHINNNGTAAGYYLDADSVAHGYVRSSDGTLTEFDPPGSIWTAAWDINDSGVVTGSYMDQYANFHAFLRTP